MTAIVIGERSRVKYILCMDTKTKKQKYLAVGAAAALPLIIVLFLQFSGLAEQKARVESETLARAEQIARLIDAQMNSELRAMQVLAMSHAVVAEDWKRAKQKIQAVANYNPHWKNVFVYDVKKNSLVLSLAGGDLKDPPSAIANLKPLQFATGGIKINANGQPQVRLYVAIPSKEVLARYILAVTIDPSTVQEILTQRSPPNTIAAVVDRAGNFIARSHEPEKFTGKPATAYLRKAMSLSRSGLYPGVTYEGFRNITGFFTSPDTGWSTHIAISSSLVNSPKYWSYTFLTLALILSALIGWFFVDHIRHQKEAIITAKLGAIVESSDDIILSKSLDGIIDSWNAAAERILGYSAEEAIGKHISLIIPEDRLKEEQEIISKIRLGESVSHYETLRRRKDGKLVNLSITVSPIRNGEGKIIGASKVAKDITDRKSIEAQLLEERETLEILNRLSPALASSLDVKQLVQMATDEATRITGAAFGAFFYNVLGEDGKALLLYTLSGAPREAFANFGMPRATAVFGQTFRGEGTKLVDDITADPNYGKNAPNHGMPKGHLPVRSYLAVSVVSRSGEVIGGLFFGHPEPGVFSQRDARIAEGIAALSAVGIDNARLYEQVKSGQKKAEDANRAKNDFLATMSHEIRTPMNAIMGLSSILSMSSPLTHKQAEFIKTLKSSADSLLLLINDLLDISKIESQAIELEAVPFSLGKLLKEVADMIAVRAKEKGLAFVVDADSVRQHIFVGDPTRVRQIIVNLCSNAVKFTNEGTVSIRVSNPGMDDLGVCNIGIVVEDTGIGIPEDKRDAIFDKFVQADTSINRKYGGTGLGLSITRTLVEAMGGTIGVESKPDNGSIFSVSLPLPLAGPEIKVVDDMPKQPALQEFAGRSGEVLVVEDYEPNILVATSFLEALGYDYDVARTGAEALEKIKTGAYRQILMDVQMPGMNGFETTAHIRAYESDTGRKRTFIIGVTAHAMVGDREKCLSAGMDDYMTKPFSLAEMGEKLFKH